MKLCSGMIEAGRTYVSANKLFVNGIKDLSQQCKKEEVISVSSSRAPAWALAEEPLGEQSLIRRHIPAIPHTNEISRAE